MSSLHKARFLAYVSSEVYPDIENTSTSTTEDSSNLSPPSVPPIADRSVEADPTSNVDIVLPSPELNPPSNDVSSSASIDRSPSDVLKDDILEVITELWKVKGYDAKHKPREEEKVNGILNTHVWFEKSL